MAMLGPDFRRGAREWLYVADNRHSWLLAISLFAVLIFISVVAQNIAAVTGYSVLGGDAAGFSSGRPETQALLMKGMIIGLFPISLVGAMAAYWFAGLRGQNAKDALALRMPRLGPGGWALVLIGFLVFVFAMNATVFLLSGIDPAQYAPTPDGMLDTKSSGGAVEKVMADLADEPLLFALAFPGITLAVPLLEELIFRGAIFSKLRHSRLGASGTIVLTSAAWAVMHVIAAPWLFVGLIFLMGLVLGVLLVRFGSLWVTIACHCLWNTLSSLTILGLASSG